MSLSEVLGLLVLAIPIVAFIAFFALIGTAVLYGAWQIFKWILPLGIGWWMINSLLVDWSALIAWPLTLAAVLGLYYLAFRLP